jgi:hypothetical protein
VTAVNITSSSNTVVVGQTLQLTANLTSASGAALSGRKVTWSSSNQSVATVSSAGLVTGVAEGSVQISAASGGQTGIIGLQVGFPYPNVSGSYAYAALFDGIPSSSANGVGVIAVAQGDRTKPDIQLAPLVNWLIGTESFNFTSAYAAIISTNGTISFRMGPQSTTTTWQHTGTRTATGGFTGRHTLAGSTSSNSGNWAMARTSAVQAMLFDRGVAAAADLDELRRALLREVRP